MSRPRSLMNAYQRTERGQPVMYLWGREDKEGKRLQSRITGFQFYFYGMKEGLKPTTVDHFGNPITKINVKSPWDIWDEKKLYDYTCEADLPHHWRYLIDKEITCGYVYEKGDAKPAEDPGVPAKVCHLDIEVLSPETVFPEAKSAEYEIVTIQCANSYDNKIVVFMYGFSDELAEKWTKEHTISWEHKGEKVSHTFDVEFRRFSNEKSMLYGFINYIARDLDPDVITAWNGDWFDYPYIIERCKKLYVPYTRLSPMKKVYMKSGYSSNPMNKYKCYIMGRDALDLMKVYKEWRVYQGQLPTYDFKYVCKLETGFEYVDYGAMMSEICGGSSVGTMLEEYGDWDTFAEYCINDAAAMKILDERIGIISTYDDKRRITGITITDAISNKKMLDAWMLRTSETPLPTSHWNEAGGYQGGIVFKSIPGIHEKVAVYDLKAMYPNIIAGFNISPDTIVDKDYDGEVISAVTPDNEKYFAKDIDGILSTAVLRFLNEREKYRERKKQFPKDSDEYIKCQKTEKQWKGLANTSYGVFAYPRFRLFNETVASSITSLAREIIMTIKRTCDEIGYKVIYGDTDSVFIQMNEDSEEERRKLEESLNEALAEFAEERNAIYPPEIKWEQTFTRILMKVKKGKGGKWVPSKKKYGGAREDGTLYIRGLEPRRSNNAEITRESITEWLKMILVENDKEKASQYLRELYDNLEEQPITKIAVPRGINKGGNNPWVRGRDYSRNVFGWQFHPGRKPMLLYIERTSHGLPDTGEICITEDVDELPEGIHVDWDTMRDRVVKSKFEGLLVSAGQSWEEVIERRKQLTWEDYNGFK